MTTAAVAPRPSFRLNFVRLTSLPPHALLLLSPSPVVVSSDRLLGRQPSVRSGAKPHGVARALCLLGLGSQGGGDSTLALELQARKHGVRVAERGPPDRGCPRACETKN